MFRWKVPGFPLPNASSPVSGHHWKQSGSILFTLSLQVFILLHIGKIPLSILFSRLNSSQPFPIREMVQSLNCCSVLSLDFLHCVHVCLVPGSPVLSWASPGLSRGDHLPLPAGSIPPNTAQDTFSLLCHREALLIYVIAFFSGANGLWAEGRWYQPGLTVREPAKTLLSRADRSLLWMWQRVHWANWWIYLSRSSLVMSTHLSCPKTIWCVTAAKASSRSSHHWARWCAAPVVGSGWTPTKAWG